MLCPINDCIKNKLKSENQSLRHIFTYYRSNIPEKTLKKLISSASKQQLTQASGKVPKD